jgi:hypothetical protein
MKGIDMHRTAWVVALGIVLVLATCVPGSAGAAQDTNRPPPATPDANDRNQRVAPPSRTPSQARQPLPQAQQLPRQPFAFDRNQQERLRADRERAARLDRLREQRRDVDDRDRNRNVDRQRRLALRRFEQEYFQRLWRNRSYWQSHGYDPYNDPYYRTAPNYRYRYNNNYYQTNRYGAGLLQAAVNFGYREGLRAGRADREDGWRFDYRNNHAYDDALYGYYGYYLDEDQYRYYFREGFRRGYEDGYYGRHRHGRADDRGAFVVLATVMSMILALEELR